ncbi:hypothetical protein SETIT_3G248400v2 [Setaria italica]|uniref:KIB1-4 beta-propeller domain-containing protein n=1 Tax=Setaria italica TaxID=4555 RepID=K3ZDH9_SETIT|nr:hypothetical protein SETIT_3G248400v2 [Setaria italica]
MHLVNLITSEQITLPSVVTIEHVKPIFDKYGVVEKYEYSRHTARKLSHPDRTFDKEVYYEPSIYALAKLREFLRCKAFVFPETSKGSYIVALIHNPMKQLSFARPGDGKWTWLPPYIYYQDCSYKNGLLYAINIVGEIHAFDLSSSVVTRKMIMGMTEKVMWDCLYIVHAPWGDLLNVSRVIDHEDETVDPAVHLLTTTEIKINKEVKCLHDRVLFLGHNQSLCLSAKDHPHLKANHAYFTGNYDLYINGFKNGRRDIGVFNLESSNWDKLVSPEPWSNWPPLMCITLSLAKMKMK